MCGVIAQVLLTARGEAIETRLLAFVRKAPFGFDAALFLETVERGVERSIEDVEGTVGGSADRSRDGVSVVRPPGKCLEDEGIERALKQRDLIGHGYLLMLLGNKWSTGPDVKSANRVARQLQTTVADLGSSHRYANDTVTRSGKRRGNWLRNNGLSLVLLALFLLCWFGQSLAGYREHNHDLMDDGQPAVSYTGYLRTPHFLEATAENWESEFVQMAFYVLLTVKLFQKGSAESKNPDGEEEEVDREPNPARPGAPAPVRRGGWMLTLYANSLSLALLTMFSISFIAHATGGAGVYNEEMVHKGLAPLSAFAYMTTSRFWFESLQNWQSEFLAVLSIVVLTIHLRQHGSPESKPVDAGHHETGIG